MDAKSYISNIINESIERLKEDKLRETVRTYVAEAVIKEGRKVKVGPLVDKLMQNDKFKETVISYLKDEGEFNGWSDSLNGKTYSSLDNQSDGSKRRTVTQRLKDRKIDYAPMAYELWPDMSQDAARSWFSKKVDGKDGESFSEDEIKKLYVMLNNTMGA